MLSVWDFLMWGILKQTEGQKMKKTKDRGKETLHEE